MRIELRSFLMKRGSKFFLVGTDDQAAGPFAWTHVREWFAIGLLGSKSLVCIQGGEAWTEVSHHPDLCTLTKSLADPASDLSAFLSRKRTVLSPRRREMLQRICNPFPLELIDDELALWLLRALAKDFPGKVDQDIAAEIQPPTPPDWRSDPASDAQKLWLTDFGLSPAPKLTKGEASDLITRLRNDPDALAISDANRKEREEREEQQRQAFPSYYLRQDVIEAEKAIREAEQNLAEADAEDIENGELILNEAKEELKSAWSARQEFWRGTFDKFGATEDYFEATESLYAQFGHYFKEPSRKQISEILDALDAASSDWDLHEPHAFYATMKSNFPNTVRRR